MDEGLSFKEIRIQIPGVGVKTFSGQIRSSERLVLVGPSGCGKTTFLRSLAGLHPIMSGSLKMNGVEVSKIPPADRHFGLTFQGGALFPGMTVLGNVMFGLDFYSQTKRWSHDLKVKQAESFLEKVGLLGLRERFPATLSGGERSRVSLVRTLINQPSLLLMDEPLTGVDVRLKNELSDWILQLLTVAPVPMILVTHDQEEAKKIGTRVVEWDTKAPCLEI
jgi:iron(III) transport system ATP-binding protein